MGKPVGMLSLSIGPLALPVPPLVLLVAVGGSAFVANWVAGRAARAAPVAHATQPADAIWVAAWLGLVGARLVHVAWHAQD